MHTTDDLLTTDDTILDEVPLERLEAEITGFASRLAAATARWLVWIAAYDRREGWASWEAKSCAHWLNWHCGVSPRTAREHVFVARKLEVFAELRSVFLAGEISYSKVRAIARVVETHNEADLIEIARHSTASQLDRITGKMPAPGEEHDTEPKVIDAVEFRNNGDGTSTLLITRPTAEIATTKKALYAKSSEVIDRQQGEGETKTDVIDRLGGMKAIHADTATSLIAGDLDAKQGTQAAVLVVADIDALTASDPTAESTVDSQRVDPSVVQRLCCDGIIQTALVDGNGHEQAIGSEHRIVPRRIRRLLERRDHGMCQFPGCESEHRLHAHHVIHWANGGKTELWNLTSLCHFHHHSVHEGGWKITSTTHGWTFHDTNGNTHAVPVLRLPSSAPIRDTAANRKNGAAAPLAGTGERINTGYVADVLVANTELRRRRADAHAVPSS